MNDFQHEVMERRRMARNAAHKKNGSKSKKCTLPHDGLSKKELMKLNGEVKTYNIHKRLSWEKFKELPDDLGKKHIEYLTETFGANLYNIAESLGVSHVTVSRYVRSHGLQRKKLPRASTPEWEAFLNGDSVLTTFAEKVVEELKEEAKPVEKPMPFLRGNLTLEGAKGQVLQRIFEVLPDNVVCTVIFEAKEV